MNEIIFLESIHDLFLKNIGTIQKSILIEDDVAVILRTHLICESFIEIWICAICNQSRMFWFQEKETSKEEKITISFNNTLKMAKTLQLPDWGFRIFQRVNTIRNNLAHQMGEDLISLQKIEGIMEIIKIDIEPIQDLKLKEFGIEVFDKNRNEAAKLKFTEACEPREKLIILIYYLIFSLTHYAKLNFNLKA